jgi:hypothetical protein
VQREQQTKINNLTTNQGSESSGELKAQLIREPGIQQGTWEIRQVRASSNNTTTRVWVDKEHIPTDQFCEAFAPDTYQEERREYRTSLQDSETGGNISRNRAIPIRKSTLEPYTVLELQHFVNKAYQDWYKAGDTSI